jgi:hypothetical protein
MGTRDVVLVALTLALVLPSRVGAATAYVSVFHANSQWTTTTSSSAWPSSAFAVRGSRRRPCTPLP